MTRSILLLLALALPCSLPACVEQSCTLIGCESSLEVDYGSVVVNEPYELRINPDGMNVVVVCLDDAADAEPLPEWLECDANGFRITGELAENTTITVGVTPVSTGEAVGPNAVVPLTVAETLEPNGPDCEPVCYVRTGSTEGL